MRSRWTGRGAFTVLFVLALFATACGGTQAPGDSGPQRARLRVTNHNWNAVVVYGVVAGSRHRIGMVSTGDTQEFELPGTATFRSDFRLMADPIGSRLSYITEPLVVMGGDLVVLTLENNISLSSLVIRDADGSTGGDATSPRARPPLRRPPPGTPGDGR